MRDPQRRICQMPSVLVRGTIVTLLGTVLAACGGAGISGSTPATSSAGSMGATGSSSSSSGGSSSSSGAAATLTVLYSFPSANGPSASTGGVVQAGDGYLYGLGGKGGLFRLSLGGAETDESLNFGTSTAGSGPPGALNGPLVLGQDGMLYDTMGCFGTSGNGDAVGAVFSSDLLGNAVFLYTNDYEAGDSCDFPPPVDLVSAPNGTLYFFNDYFGDGGEVDGLTPSTQFVQFAFRGQGAAGANMIGSDGNLYGVSQSGGNYGNGFFYTLTTITGVSQAQILYSFGATPNDASKPTQAPAQGLDGNFYGPSAGGSSTPSCPAGCGAIYRMTAAGDESVLYSFGSNPADQASPMCSPGPLTLGSDGDFYGTYCSVVFQITPEGQETILHTMTAAEGQRIANSLLQASDGNLYGVTTTSGANNAGTVFKLEVPGSH
jgi:uncharacterized repeat protein (TIGR03803 family)